MTAPMIPPLRDEAEMEYASRAIHHWRASDLTLDSVNGAIGTLTRTTVSVVNDLASASFTSGYVTPSFEPRVWTNSLPAMTLRLGGAEYLDWDANWLPKAFAFYHEFEYNGMPTGALWSISNTAGTGARVVLDSTGTYFRLRHHNGTTEVTATLATVPTMGGRIRLWGYVGADGSVQLSQSSNENPAVATTTSAANTLASAWAATPRLRLSALGTTAGASAGTRHRVFKLVAGTPSVTQLQRYF